MSTHLSELSPTIDLFLEDGWVSGYFDTKYITILQIDQILHNFEDQKIADFFNLEQVNFRVTLVMYVYSSKPIDLLN